MQGEVLFPAGHRLRGSAGRQTEAIPAVNQGRMPIPSSEQREGWAAMISSASTGAQQPQIRSLPAAPGQGPELVTCVCPATFTWAQELRLDGHKPRQQLQTDPKHSRFTAEPLKNHRGGVKQSRVAAGRAGRGRGGQGCEGWAGMIRDERE